MSAQIKLQLAPEAERIVRNLQTMPTDMVAAVARAMDQGNQLAVSQIQRFHLTGKGPFPVEEHKLGRVSGLLRESVSASPAVVQDTKVRSSIGSNVVYAAIHEFGGRIHHEPREMKLRHRVDASGNLVKQLENSNLLMFAKSSHKRVRETTVEAKAYDVTMPERAPFRAGILETLPTYKQLISAAIVAAWNKN
jgi:phage gpG-like protein